MYTAHSRVRAQGDIHLKPNFHFTSKFSREKLEIFIFTSKIFMEIFIFTSKFSREKLEIFILEKFEYLQFMGFITLHHFLFLRVANNNNAGQNVSLDRSGG